MGAEGGDIVILDPHDGDILAMASRRRTARDAATALTEPFEPGSTVKPFIAAGLLERGRVRETRSVNTGDGISSSTAADHHDEHLDRPRAAGGSDPLVEQHRHREVRAAAHAARGVRDAARLRLRHADRRAVSRRSRPACCARRARGRRSRRPRWRWATRSPSRRCSSRRRTRRSRTAASCSSRRW